MGKAKHKISNWQQYNQALVNRGSLTVWMGDEAIRQCIVLKWLCSICYSALSKTIMPDCELHYWLNYLFV